MEKAGKLVKLELAPEGVGRAGGELGHQYCLKFVTTQIDDKDDNEGGDYHHGGHSAPVYVGVNIHSDVLVKARCHDHVKRLLYLKNRNSLVALF